MRWTYDRCARWEIVWEDTTANDAISNVMTERKGRWRDGMGGMDTPGDGRQDRRGAADRRAARDGATTSFPRGDIYCSEG